MILFACIWLCCFVKANVQCWHWQRIRRHVRIRMSDQVMAESKPATLSVRRAGSEERKKSSVASAEEIARASVSIYKPWGPVNNRAPFVSLCPCGINGNDRAAAWNGIYRSRSTGWGLEGGDPQLWIEDVDGGPADVDWGPCDRVQSWRTFGRPCTSPHRHASLWGALRTMDIMSLGERFHQGLWQPFMCNGVLLNRSACNKNDPLHGCVITRSYRIKKDVCVINNIFV